MDPEIGEAFAELGLSPEASEREVKAAWRRLVSQWHPDRNTSAAAHARMQRINRAVEAIRRAGFTAPAAPPTGAGGDEDKRTTEPPARTIDRKVRLTLEEAAAGCTRVLRGRIVDACAACAGAGFRLPAEPCPRCQGAGTIRQRAWFAWVGVQTACDACLGSGQFRPPCAACSGSGRAPARRYQVGVRIPPGVRDGDLLHVAADQFRAGVLPGELNIRVALRPHEWLRLDRDGSVHCELPVDGFAWIANRPVDVPTLVGLQSLALQRGQLEYRLEGQGFPVERRGPRGDQWVTITPVFPPQMSTDQQILLDQLIATTSGPDAESTDPRLRAWQQALRRQRRR
ncbi:MAG: J domain-containing protein [Burkholderiaceae bacterium]|nr:J domain-containing protein [Burkholderiaceae bacterium]